MVQVCQSLQVWFGAPARVSLTYLRFGLVRIRRKSLQYWLGAGAKCWAQNGGYHLGFKTRYGAHGLGLDIMPRPLMNVKNVL